MAMMTMIIMNTNNKNRGFLPGFFFLDWKAAYIGRLFYLYIGMKYCTKQEI